MSACPVPQPSRPTRSFGLPTLAGISAESQPAALRGLESDVLLRRLGMIHAREGVSTAEVLVHMIEVQRRKLYRSAACSCMYIYCQRKLRMSKAEAFRRTTGARLGRQYPVILEAIADGRLNLTALALLSPHIKPLNVYELVSAFAHKTIRETLQLLAERFPKQDAPTVMRALVCAVAANTAGGAATERGLDGAWSDTLGASAGQDSVTELFSRRVDTTNSGISAESTGPLQACAAGSGSTQADVVAAAATQLTSQIVAQIGAESSASGASVAPQAILHAVSQALAQAVANDPGSAEAIELRAKLTPLSPGRHCWQLTVDQESQDLMDEALNYVELGSRAPQEALKQALRCFVEQHRKQKFAQVARPRAQRTGSSSHVPKCEACDQASPGESNLNTSAAGANQRAVEGEKHASHPSAGAHRPAPEARPQPQPGAPRSRHIPAEVQRAVYARDGGQCTFESADHTRCDERRNLQFDHRIPFACGGESTVDNVRQLCPEHNRHEADLSFGPEHVQARIHESRARSERTKGVSRTP